MPKCLIVYFSQGGTTRQVAESIAAGLRSAEYQVALYDLTAGQPPDPDGYDLLGVGTPAYYYCPPFNVTDYVKGLPGLDGLPVFTFVLHGAYRGDAGNAIRHTLSRKGGREAGYFHCYGDDYYHCYLKQGYLFSPDHPTAEELAQAEEFGREVAAQAQSKAPASVQDDPAPGAIYRLERALMTNRWLARQVYSRLFRVNKDRCNACGLCIQECPTGNISADGEGQPVWDRDCLLCLFCEMNCPEEAITSPVSWPLFLPVVKYNVGQASRDPTLDHVRVKHSRGRTQRL